MTPDELLEALKLRFDHPDIDVPADEIPTGDEEQARFGARAECF